MPVSASGEKARALFDRDPDLVRPVDVVGNERHQPELLGLDSRQRRADAGPGGGEPGGIGQEPGLKPGDAVGHGKRAEISCR